MPITRRDISPQTRTAFQQLLENQSIEASFEDNSRLIREQLQFIQRNFQIQNQPELRQIFQILTDTELPEDFDFEFNINMVEVNSNPGGGNGNATATTTETFVTDPYQGNINPGSSDGAKLYKTATEALSDGKKIEIILKNAHQLLRQLIDDANKFGWEDLFFGIPKDDQGGTLSLDTDSQKITKNMILKQAYKTWGNKDATFADNVPDTKTVETLSPETDATHRPHFYRRVKSKMIALRVKGYMTAADWENLRNDKDLFTWNKTGSGHEMDGPTIIWKLLQTCNPSTRVGVENLKDNIRNVTSAKFNHDVQKLTDYLKKNYREIREKSMDYDDYLTQVYRALGTVPNAPFHSWVQDDLKEWYLGNDRKPDTVMTQALQLYNNSKKKGGWTTKDPKEAKLISLMTKLESISQNFSTVLATDAPFSKPNNISKPSVIEDWRKKKTQNSVTRSGKTWHWCTKHKRDGEYDGLYVTHEEKDHDKWLERKKENQAKRANNKGNTSNGTSGNKPNNTTGSGGRKLTLSDAMKSVMTTKTNVSGAEFRQMLDEAKSLMEDFQ